MRRNRPRPPRVIPRHVWTTRAPKTVFPLHLPVPRSWVHHTAAAFPRDPSFTEKTFRFAQRRYLRGIQDFHMDDRGWNDIAYSYIFFTGLFGLRPTIYEGRGANVGAHTEGDNSSSIGVAIAGNFTVDKLGLRAVTKLRRFFDELHRSDVLGGARADHPTGGHQDAPGASTECPGKHAQRRLPRLRKPALSPQRQPAQTRKEIP